MSPQAMKIFTGVGFVVVVVVVVVILIVAGVFESKPAAASPAPAPAETKEEQESIEADKCYTGDDVRIDCVAPGSIDTYTYATFKKGATRKVPCTLTVPCIVPPAERDVELRVKPGFVKDIEAAGQEPEIFKRLCEADYNCSTDPIYKALQPGGNADDAVMLLDSRTNCHNPALIGTCVDTYFDMMKATAWKANPELVLSEQGQAIVTESARKKVVPAPTEIMSKDDKSRLQISSMDLPRFEAVCDRKGYEFAKNCELAERCKAGSNYFPGETACRAEQVTTPSAGRARAPSTIPGVPQVHDYPLSLRRLADSYCV